MKAAVFSARGYDRRALTENNVGFGHALSFFDEALSASTAPLAQGFGAVCAFVNDRLDAATLQALHAAGVNFVALRCAGYNHVDLDAAERFGIAVTNAPAYSPHSVAEFAVGLLLALNRKIHRAWARVREDNFALDGLVGRDLYGKTAGVIGVGAIGAQTARILRLGLGCQVLAYDIAPSADLAAIGVNYVDLPSLLTQSDVISLHCPLNEATLHLIDAAALARVKPGLLLVNTSRGGLIDTTALLDALKAGRLAGAALDVYERESDLFFQDRSSEVVQDDDFQRLLTFPNVLLTAHQAFLTQEALDAIAQTTLQTLADAQHGRPLRYQLKAGVRIGPPRP